MTDPARVPVPREIPLQTIAAVDEATSKAVSEALQAMDPAVPEHITQQLADFYLQWVGDDYNIESGDLQLEVIPANDRTYSFAALKFPPPESYDCFGQEEPIANVSGQTVVTWGHGTTTSSAATIMSEGKLRPLAWSGQDYPSFGFYSRAQVGGLSYALPKVLSDTHDIPKGRQGAIVFGEIVLANGHKVSMGGGTFDDQHCVRGHGVVRRGKYWVIHAAYAKIRGIALPMPMNPQPTNPQSASLES